MGYGPLALRHAAHLQSIGMFIKDARRRRGARKSVKLKGFTGFLKGSEGFAGVAPAGLKINRFC